MTAVPSAIGSVGGSAIFGEAACSGGEVRTWSFVICAWCAVDSSSMTAFPWSTLEPCTQISFATGAASGSRRPPSVNFTTHLTPSSGIPAILSDRRSFGHFRPDGPDELCWPK